MPPPIVIPAQSLFRPYPHLDHAYPPSFALNRSIYIKIYRISVNSLIKVLKLYSNVHKGAAYC